MFEKSIIVGALLSSSFTYAQSFSINSTSSVLKSVNTGYFKGSNSITQNVDPATIIPGNSASCTTGGLHTNNSYFRRFDLNSVHGITDWLDVTSIDIGIDEAVSGTGGTQPISIRLYTIPNADALIIANLTLTGSLDTTIADISTSIQNFPITGSAGGTNKDLVVEINTPEGITDGHSFKIGSNNLGQTTPSYILAASCFIVEILDIAVMGSANMHIVMTVNGDLNLAPVELQNFSVE